MLFNTYNHKPFHIAAKQIGVNLLSTDLLEVTAKCLWWDESHLCTVCTQSIQFFLDFPFKMGVFLLPLEPSGITAWKSFSESEIRSKEMPSFLKKEKVQRDGPLLVQRGTYANCCMTFQDQDTTSASWDPERFQRSPQNLCRARVWRQLSGWRERIRARASAPHAPPCLSIGCLFICVGHPGS